MLLGGVTLFLFGLGLLSGGLQKVAGDGLRAFLASMTSNPFKQIITGIGVTAVIQSSTATTIMVVKIVKWIYPDKEGSDEVFRLKYISGGPLPTAELSLEEANKEIMDFGRICRKGFAYIRQAVNTEDEDKFEEYRQKLVRYEEITDRMEEDTDYSYQTGVFYMDIIADLEKIGDFIINISQAKVKE